MSYFRNIFLEYSEDYYNNMSNLTIEKFLINKTPTDLIGKNVLIVQRINGEKYTEIHVKNVVFEENYREVGWILIKDGTSKWNKYLIHPCEYQSTYPLIHYVIDSHIINHKDDSMNEYWNRMVEKNKKKYNKFLTVTYTHPSYKIATHPSPDVELNIIPFTCYCDEK